MAKLIGIPEATFVALQHIRETALTRYDSLFTPEHKLWSLENLGRFHVLFVERFDLGAGSFLEKWQTQLEGAGDDLLQLAAELLYVQQFFTSVTGPEKKLENVRDVLAWCKQPPSIPNWAIDGLSWGLARDQSFNQHRPFHLGWLDEYLIHWQELPEGERSQLLNDPWRYAQDVRAIEFSHGAHQPMREAWLYMIFPDNFENISSRTHKQQIRDAFNELLPNGTSSNIDLDLYEIRKRLTSKYGEGFHFYELPIVEKWQQSSGPDQDMTGQIRDQITRQDILDAIAALDRNEPHPFGPSTSYDLLESGRRYPPKAVVGLAARRAVGRLLRPDEFSGGLDSWAFRLLRDRGFEIVQKDAADTPAKSAGLQRIWLYAPGPRAMYWGEFHDAGIAAIECDYVGDLSGFETPEALKARMDQLSEEPKSLVDATQCFDFARRMKPGDWIFAKKGRREIVGFGIVKSDYHFDKERPTYTSVRDVAWRMTGSWPTASTRLLPMKTVTDITDNEALVDELEQLLNLVEPLSVKPAIVPLPIYTIELFAMEFGYPGGNNFHMDYPAQTQAALDLSRSTRNWKNIRR